VCVCVCLCNQFELYEPVSQGRRFTGPVGNGSGSGENQGFSRRGAACYSLARRRGKDMQVRDVKGISPIRALGGSAGRSPDMQKCG
jgi:hypothetical protein